MSSFFTPPLPALHACHCRLLACTCWQLKHRWRNDVRLSSCHSHPSHFDLLIRRYQPKGVVGDMAAAEERRLQRLLRQPLCRFWRPPARGTTMPVKRRVDGAPFRSVAAAASAGGCGWWGADEGRTRRRDVMVKLSVVASAVWVRHLSFLGSSGNFVARFGGFRTGDGLDWGDGNTCHPLRPTAGDRRLLAG